MWKITNKKNKYILDDFEKYIIKIFFGILLEISYKNENKYNLFSSIDESSYKKTHVYNICLKKDVIDYVFDKQVKFKKINMFILTLVKTYSYNELFEQYMVYLKQNKQINKLDYNLKESLVKSELKFIFTDIFYEKLFSDKKVWRLLSLPTYNRNTFHENFKEENKIEVCPYCDIDTTISLTNNEVEHFLPKIKFPFISMNAYNLISSCTACNKIAEGKGQNYYTPIIAPFNKQIGDSIKYTLISSKEKILLKSQDKSEDNYLKLLQLNKRYESKKIFNTVFFNAKTIFDTLIEFERFSGKKLDATTINVYIEKQLLSKKKRNPLFFATKYNICNFDEYKKLINI